MSAMFRAKTVTMLVFCALLPTACAVTNTQAPEISPDSPEPGGKVLVMPLDIQVSELTAAGLQVPRADWTDAAELHFLNAQNSVLNACSIDLLALPESAVKAPRDDIITQTSKLHAAVGGSILLHGDGSQLPLPTKKNAFDWTLGQEVREISNRHYPTMRFSSTCGTPSRRADGRR